jgi:hypothetical protein
MLPKKRPISTKGTKREAPKKIGNQTPKKIPTITLKREINDQKGHPQKHLKKKQITKDGCN